MFNRLKWVIPVSVLVLLAGALAKAGVSQLVLYDNFQSRKLDPSKWNGWQFFDFNVLDAARQLSGEEENRRLHLSLTAYAPTTDDFGASGGGFGLAFPNPGAVTEVSFDLTVNGAVAIGCSSNPNGQIVTGAEFRGRFFNTESSPTSQLGDIETVIAANRNGSDTGPAMEVIGFFQRCPLGPSGPRNLMKITPG